MWNNEWENERSVLLLNQLRRVNANLERSFEGRANTETREEVTSNERNGIKIENALLKAKLKKTTHEMNNLKRSRDFYRMALFIVVLFCIFLHFQ